MPIRPFCGGGRTTFATLFGDRVAHLRLSRRTYVERASSPQDYCRLFAETFGPMVAIRAGLDRVPAERTALDRAFLDAVIRWNHGRASGPVEIAYEYLLVVAQTAVGNGR